MRQLTLREVQEQYGGRLPPDAVFRPSDEELAAQAAARAADAARRAAAKPKRRTRSERFAILNAFVDMGMAGLTGAEAKTWLVLFRDTKGTGTARTAQADIARRAGLSVRAVKLAVRSLTAKGMVRLVHRGRINAGPSIYTVHPVGTHGAT